jgi:phage shock protein PspC (stress-responsive transcriptional regulator)
MKEVTRIRIAKTSYDIELGAKKQLEQYIKSLSLYADDENILEDIEIRITELLAERGIIANDAIDSGDVEALRKVLGEPQDFLSEGDIALGDDSEGSTSIRPKWYRDIDRAVLGGVLSGLARYLSVNALWIRLGFIALIFVSLGLAAFVYILFWIILPPAVTVTEKLQAQGEAVTLAAIRRQNEGEAGSISTSEKIKSRRKIFGLLLGIASTLIALGGLGLTIAGGYVFGLSRDVLFDGQTYNRYGFELTVVALLVASGLLFTIFWVLVAVASFRTKVTKRLMIILSIITVLGLGAFAAGTVLYSQQAWQRQDTIQKSIKSRPVVLPTGFSQSKKLVVDAENIMVIYHASSESRAVLTSVPGVKAELQSTNDELKVTAVAANLADLYLAGPVLEVYGPQLDSLEVLNGEGQYYSSSKQDITVNGVKGFASLLGAYGKATLNASESGAILATGADITDVTATMQADASISLGNIASLILTQPTTCATGVQSKLVAESIASGQLTLNGVVQAARNDERTCGVVDLGDDYTGYRD